MGTLVQQCLGRGSDGVHIETHGCGGSSDQRSHQCCLSLGQGGVGRRSGSGAHATTALAPVVIGGRPAAAAMASSSSSSSAAGG